MRGEDKDRTLDPLLKSMLRGSMPPATPACVDPETLAAWSEGSLSPQQASGVELHLSNCARCQAILATLARIPPLEPAASVPFWQRWQVRWLIPAGAIA